LSRQSLLLLILRMSARLVSLSLLIEMMVSHL
jgi:hypothetical protein